MITRLRRGICLGGFLMVFASGQAVLGQTLGGSVTGTVQDSSGAVVARASVTLANVATGVKLTTQSSSAGEFVFPVAVAGQYTLVVSAAGFAQSVVSNVIVALNKTTTENIVLSVGATTTRVEVKASLVQLEVATAQATSGIDENTYANLPISNSGTTRSPSMVADLMPGVADGVGFTTASPSAGNSQTYSTSVNGGQSEGSEVLYDGVAMAQTNVAGDLRVQPIPVEALSEFNLVQNIFSAEYSRTPGGIFSFVTRSGTNRWHGDAYEFNENTDYEARGHYAATVPVLIQNEFGISVGGPIKKDKTFVFGWYSGFRYTAAPVVGLATIPTAAELLGNFSGYTVGGQVIPIYDPATTSCNAQGVCSRTQFPGNIIPTNRIVPQAAAFIPYIPTKLLNSNLTNNFLPQGVNFTTENRYGVKIDQYFSNRDIVHFIFGESPNTSQAGGTLAYAAPFQTGDLTLPDNFLATRISEDHTFSPTLLNHITLGYNRNNGSNISPCQQKPLTLGIPNIIGEVCSFSWTGYYSAGTGEGETVLAENGVAFSDFLSWVKGKHDLKIGVDVQRSEDNQLPGNGTTFGFNYTETDQPSATNTATTGNAFASFLVGAEDSAALQDYPNELSPRFAYFGTFVQDNYKVSRKLTVNLGLRWDIPFTRTSAHNILSSFDPTMPNPGAGNILGALAFAGNGSAPYCNCNRFADVRYNGWQPRFGFAYQLRSKTVIRGGIGLFDDSNGDVLENGIRGRYGDGYNSHNSFSPTNLGVTPVAYLNTTGLPAFTLPPIISASFDNGGTIGWERAQDGTVGKIVNWSLDVQRTLPGSFLLDVGYFGNSGHHLAGLEENPDQVNPSYLSLGSALNAQLSSAAGQATGVPTPYPGFVGTVAQALRPYPQYGTMLEWSQTSANSHYNSLQVKMQRQFTNGLSVLLSYTYSKLMTDAEYGQSDTDTGTQNSYNLAAEMSPSAQDYPQILKLSYVYDFPVGTGKRFFNQRGVPNAILGGWRFTAIQTYESGAPLV